MNLFFLSQKQKIYLPLALRQIAPNVEFECPSVIKQPTRFDWRRSRKQSVYLPLAVKCKANSLRRRAAKDKYLGNSLFWLQNLLSIVGMRSISQTLLPIRPHIGRPFQKSWILGDNQTLCLDGWQQEICIGYYEFYSILTRKSCITTLFGIHI